MPLKEIYTVQTIFLLFALYFCVIERYKNDDTPIPYQDFVRACPTIVRVGHFQQNLSSPLHDTSEGGRKKR